MFCVAGRVLCSKCASSASASRAIANLSRSKDVLDPVQECHDLHRNFTFAPGKSYCNSTYDSYLCWSPAAAGDVVSQHCPPARLSDTTRFAHRRCGENGLWLGKKPEEFSLLGWTNYTPCFPSEVQSLFVKVYDSEMDGQVKFEIAQRTRNMEIVGFSISLVALTFSLMIFSYYRTLRNTRTRIHKSLFCAMVVQVVIRLTVYIDQALIRSNLEDHSTYDEEPLKGIDNMPYLCEATYILLEYAITVMFMWMFIEGLYLHNVVTVNALRERISYTCYYVIGWCLPFLLTVVWASVTAHHYQRDRVKKCWYGYNFSPTYWLMQGPRLAVIMINLVFLLNIMRVLIVKLKRSQDSELKKVRKAVRAALVLLPLLGITNVLSMIEAPLDGAGWQFGLWSYSTHFLRSFQGLFIALIYCFLNAEVREVLRKHYTNVMAVRADNRRYRHSFRNFMSSSSGENAQGQAPPTMLALRRLSELSGGYSGSIALGVEARAASRRLAAMRGACCSALSPLDVDADPMGRTHELTGMRGGYFTSTCALGGEARAASRRLAAMRGGGACYYSGLSPVLSPLDVDDADEIACTHDNRRMGISYGEGIRSGTTDDGTDIERDTREHDSGVLVEEDA